MGEFKTGAVKQYKEKVAFDEEQKRLKEQHNIDEDCIVVEKNNAGKFIINLFIRLIKVLGTVTLLTNVVRKNRLFYRSRKYQISSIS